MKASPDFPNTEPNAHSPAPPSSGEGVWLAAGPRAPGGPAELILHGTFQLSVDSLAKLQDAPHRALVFVVWATTLQEASRPFRDVALFEDDLERTADGARGHFNVRFDGGRGHPEDTFYVSVSLGQLMSNSVQLRL